MVLGSNNLIVVDNLIHNNKGQQPPNSLQSLGGIIIKSSLQTLGISADQVYLV